MYGHVFCQVGNIENEYRVFQMDVIAGKPVLETEVKQHSARFKLDYSQVQCATRQPCQACLSCKACGLAANIMPCTVHSKQSGITAVHSGFPAFS